MKKLTSYLSLWTLLALPYAVSAATAGLGNSGGGTAGRGNTGNSSNAVSFGLDNPLRSDSLMDFFIAILDVIMVFAVPIIVFFIILAGFQFVMASGSSEGIEKSKKALLYAIVGGLIILGAKIILEVIQGTVNAF